MEPFHLLRLDSQVVELDSQVDTGSWGSHQDWYQGRVEGFLQSIQASVAKYTLNYYNRTDTYPSSPPLISSPSLPASLPPHSLAH